MVRTVRPVGLECGSRCVLRSAHHHLTHFPTGPASAPPTPGCASRQTRGCPRAKQLHIYIWRTSGAAYVREDASSYLHDMYSKTMY